MKYEKVPEETWNFCKICGISKKDIKNDGGKYFSERFLKHLEEHEITKEQYFSEKCGLKIPLCVCGCGNRVKIDTSGKNIVFRKAIRGHYDKEKHGIFVEKMKIERKGSGNPMYGKKAWNIGLTKETNESVKRISEKITGIKRSEETIQKNRVAKKGKGHTGKKHSQETIDLIRKKTLEQIKNGVFSQLRSKPFLAMKQFLEELNIKFVEEQESGYFSFDFYLPEYNIYIEVDGDYFHSNPLFYPNGPISKTQKNNWERDKRKNNYVKENTLILYRFWENDIIKNIETVKEKLKGIILCTPKGL
jgi:very-short-patch-repair endonuclease